MMEERPQAQTWNREVGCHEAATMCAVASVESVGDDGGQMVVVTVWRAESDPSVAGGGGRPVTLDRPRSAHATIARAPHRTD